LNWKSPSRPTRSIESLYIELFPDEKSASQNAKRSASVAGTLEPPVSPVPVDARRQSESQAPKRERRHQIPGLRRTPYLKIYFLRCDDSDTYKNSSRKLLREWIKANTPPSQSSGSTSNQENHDAFEWMIVHVVLPDVQNGSIWPTKASASVLDKIKSDFNSSSRSAPDRVVQIPATKDLQVQGVTVSGIPTGPARELFIQESNRAWEDLIAKLKVLILSSFDLRVRQYEEDIKEKGSQRNLPGWNFCTFFVLKEGLARGFESVGLVEDALMGYDELSAELLLILQEEGGKDTKLFREHTQELLIQAESALEGKEISPKRPNAKRLSNSLFDVDKKPFRELILANNISAFDFRSYVFARQTQIMLRLASLSGPIGKASNTNPQSPVMRDPTVLADVCRRAINFFADMARVIRQDLKTSFKAETGASEAILRARYNVTENLIASWTFKAAQQILEKTKEPNLPDYSITSSNDVPEQSQKTATASPLGSPLSPGSNTRPENATISTVVSTTLSKRPEALEDRNFTFNPSQKEKANLPAVVVALASERAELYLIARRALASIAERLGWATDWINKPDNDITGAQLDEISLDDEPARDQETKKTDTKVRDASLAGVLDDTMREYLAESNAFYTAYEDLSLHAFKLYQIAGERKSASSITADVAAIHCRLDDFATGAKYLRELAPFYAQNKWSHLEIAILDMYAYCLKKLGRTEEYVWASLKMLSRIVQARKSLDGRSYQNSFVAGQQTINPSDIGSLVAASESLGQALLVPLDEYCENIKVGPYIQHRKGVDGFILTISFDYQLHGSFVGQEAKVQLLSTAEGSTRDIWLYSQGHFKIQQGNCKITVVSQVCIACAQTL
jgi:trafficking protein particle complex subunit 10